MYKVLKRVDGKCVSPFQEYKYEPGKQYECEDFDSNPHKDCSRGFHATGIDGLIYSFRNLPGYEVWEVETGGRSVEINQFKRRYEQIKLIREVPLDEVKELALAEEEKVGYKLAEALFPVNPLLVKRTGPVTEDEIELLKKWDSIGYSVGDSIRDSVGAYTSSLFPGITKWEHIDHLEGENPFQPCVDLWHKGLVPSYDGETWRLHAGKKAEVVWEGSFDRTGGEK